MTRHALPTRSRTPATVPSGAAPRLAHALDRAWATGPGGAPTLDPIVRAYAAACRSRAMPLDLVLAALAVRVAAYGCRRGPARRTNALAAHVARCASAAYAAPPATPAPDGGAEEPSKAPGR